MNWKLYGLLGAGLAGLTVSPAFDAAASDPAALDGAKKVIERGPKAVAAKGAPAGAGPFVNPKVAPGKVRWHADYAAACKAAAKSGKPVLLFQMMGKLDDRFC